MTGYVVVVLLGYVIGSIPFGLLMARVARGIDIREVGSGKMGATNVLRSVGRPAAAAVLGLDIGKTVAAVLIARAVSGSPGPEVAAALSALVGHNWPIFTGFKGGRGTAPGFGGLIILSPWSALAASVLGLPAIALSRYMSLGSVVGASTGGLVLFILALLGFYPIEYGAYALIGWAIVVLSHRDNIKRILDGTERKVGKPAKSSPAQGRVKGGRRLGWPGSAS